MAVEAKPTSATEPASGSRTDVVLAVSIFAFALTLRLLHLMEIRANDPFFAAPSVDGAFYHDWALKIAAGTGPDGVYFLGPLYPHFLALLYTLFGPSFLAVKATQCVLGAASCALVFALARELFDRRVAVLAGLLAAVYEMSIFFEGTTMIVNVQLPLVLGVLLATVRGLRAPRARTWLAAGMLLGLSALARPTALLFAPAAALWLLLSLRDRADLSRRLAWAGLFCVGTALVIAPVTLRNYAESGDFVLVTSTGGYALWMGNNPDADGGWQPPRLGTGTRIDNPEAMRRAFSERAEQELGRPLSPSEVSSFWAAEAFAFIRESPRAWLQLEARKLGFFWNQLEIWTNRSHILSREFSWVLRLPLPGFGVVAPLGLLGIALSLGAWRRLMPLYLMLGVYLSVALAFYVLSRYRMASVPILMIFAASGVVACVDAVRARRGRRIAAALSLVALFTFVVHRDMGEPNLSMAYYNLGNKYKAEERWPQAVESYTESLRLNRHRIGVWNNLALAYEGGGATFEAAETWRYILLWAERDGLDTYRERARRRLRGLGVDPDAPPAGPAAGGPP